MAEPINLSDDAFNKLLEESGDTPVLVDFWAEWCGPCRMIAPIVKDMANEYEGKAIITKMDIDSNPMIPGRYAVRSIPTVMIFKGGEVVERIVGAKPGPVFKAALENHLLTE